jgi:hypothetical protein
MLEDRGLDPPQRPKWVSPFSDAILSLCFAGFLLAPLVAYLAGWKSANTLHENRNLAPAPNFSTDSITSLPGKLEAYYDDRFGFRSDLVRFQNTLLHKYLKASSDDVVIGKKRWVFYARDNIFSDFLGKAPFSGDDLKRWKDHIENRQNMLAQRNSRYLFVIAPDKNTVYPEMLPDFLIRHRGRSRLQQLRQYLQATSSPVDILDLHQALIAAKPQGTLYFPQDTHWNGRGFFVAYQAMCARLNQWFPEIVPQLLGRDYAIHVEAWSGGEWSLFGLTEENETYASEFLVPLNTQKARKAPLRLPVGVIPAIQEPWNAPLYWEGNGKHSLLVLHDSYMRTGMLDGDQVPLAENFARTLLVGRHFSDIELSRIVDVFHPDVVIEEWAERLLAGVPPLEAPLQHPGYRTVVVQQKADLSDCSRVEAIVGLNSGNKIEAVNAVLEKRPAGIAVIASTEDPFLLLPPLQHQVDGVSVKITTPAPVTMELYAIADDRGAWAIHPVSSNLQAGINEVLLSVPREKVQRFRLDLGKKKLVYVIHDLHYLSGCR